MQDGGNTSTFKSGFYYGYIIVIAIFITMVFAFGSNFAFGVFFKPVQDEFNWTRAMTAGAFSLCMIVQGIMGTVMGGLTDRFGPRLVMTVSGILIGIGYFLMAQVNSLWQLYVFYGLIIGVGMSSGYVTLLSTTARWFVKRRNLMTGIVLIGMSIGTLLAPPISERLISSLDWRTSYIITAVAVAVVVISAAQFLKREPSSVGQVPDGKKVEDRKVTDLNNQGFTLKEAFKQKQYWFFMVIEICFGFLLFSVMVHIVNHAIDLQIPVSRAVVVLSALGAFSIVGRVALGNLADRIGNKKIFMVGLILLVAALLWLFQLKEEWMLYVFAAVFGIAYGGVETSESPMTAWIFGLKSHGLVFGTLSLGFTVGASLGPLMTGFIFDINGSYKLAFIILAAIGVIGIAFTAFLRPLIKNEN